MDPITLILARSPDARRYALSARDGPAEIRQQALDRAVQLALTDPAAEWSPAEWAALAGAVSDPRYLPPGLTVQEVASRVGRSIWSIRRDLRAGNIPGAWAVEERGCRSWRIPDQPWALEAAAVERRGRPKAHDV